MSRVILLWSGGKDAMQALCHAREAGHQVAALVTFAPPAPRFLAHPLSQVRRQAAALGLPHLLAPEWTGRTLGADTLTELQQLAEREGFDESPLVP